MEAPKKTMASKSITEFMKELTAITGKYGDELFDYVLEKVGKPQTNENEKNEQKNWSPAKESDCFHGTTDEIKQFYLLRGGKESVAKWFGSCCPELVCSHVATVCDVREFYWTRPVLVQDKNNGMRKGWARYGVKWDESTKRYADVESKLISREEEM